jgi:hypothetical protein
LQRDILPAGEAKHHDVQFHAGVSLEVAKAMLKDFEHRSLNPTPGVETENTTGGEYIPILHR